MLHSVHRGIRRGTLCPQLAWCEKVAKRSPKNYQLWHHRRSLLDLLEKPPTNELALLVLSTTRCFSLSVRRGRLVRNFPNGCGYLHFFCSFDQDAIFAKDAKNYHVWSHRQWVLQRFNLWDGEIAFVEKLIDADVRTFSR